MVYFKESKKAAIIFSVLCSTPIYVLHDSFFQERELCQTDGVIPSCHAYIYHYPQHYFSGESSTKAIFFIKRSCNCYFSFDVHDQLPADRMVVRFAHFSNDCTDLSARVLGAALSPAVVLESRKIGG